MIAAPPELLHRLLERLIGVETAWASGCHRRATLAMPSAFREHLRRPARQLRAFV
jgi:hypothetical protein